MKVPGLKVVLINTLYAPLAVGGAEKSVQSLAERLVSSRDYSVTVITLCEGSQTVRERMNGVDIVRLPLANVYWPFGDKPQNSFRRHLWHVVDILNPVMAYRVGRLLRQIRPDIVHTNNLSGFSPAVWLAARFHGISLVHTLRDYYLLARNSTLYGHGQQQDPSKFSTQLFSWPKKLVSRVVHSPVAISEAVATLHRTAGFFGSRPLTVIANGIESPERVAARVAGEPLVFGYIGRLEQSKGVDKLLRAYAELPQHVNVRLKVAGRSNRWFERELAGLPAGIDIELLGWTEFAEFVAQVDVVVVPSQWQEPFGRVVIESFAHGRPVLVSDRGGLPELVPEEGGVVFPASSGEGLREGLLEIANNVRDNVYDARRVRDIAARYSMDATLESYVRLYDELAR